jgi:hypothetical protein
MAKGLSPLQHAILRTLAGRPSLYASGELADDLPGDALSFQAREPRVARNSLRRALYRLWERGLIMRTAQPCKNPDTGRVAFAWGLATEEVLAHNCHIEAGFIVSPACPLHQTDDPGVSPDPTGTQGAEAGTAAHPMAGIAADAQAISATSDDDPAAGSSPPFRNLFSVDSEAWQQEFPFTGAPPIGLGGTRAAGTGHELLAAVLQYPELLMRYAMGQLGPQKSAALLVERYGQRKAWAAVKGKPGRRRLTQEQIQHRLLLDRALRLDGCTSETERAEILAKAYGGTPESVRQAIRDARARSVELGLGEPPIGEEEQRWLAKRVRDAASSGGKKLRSFLSVRRR